MIVQNLNFDQTVALAKTKAEKMIENGLYSRFRLSDKERLDKALLGCIGELAFQQHLSNLGIPFELDHTDFQSHHTDEFDVKVNGAKIDIKVAKKTTANPPSDNWTYGYPQEQHPETKDYVVVGWVDFNRKEVGFYGWIRGEQIVRFKVVTRNSYAKYPYLTPNHEFKWGCLTKDLNEILK